MLHVPQKCERAQSHVSSSQPQSAGRTGFYVPNVLTELLSSHSVLVLRGAMSHFQQVLSIHVYFHLGVKTRWKKVSKVCVVFLSLIIHFFLNK